MTVQESIQVKASGYYDSIILKVLFRYMLGV